MNYLTSALIGNGQPRRAGIREYIVAPATLIVPGVLAGSQGALLYPPEETSKTAGAWDAMPIVLDHPAVDGAFVSANTPGVRRIGVVRSPNARPDGTLTAEAWFDVEETRRASPALLMDLRAKRKVELSTGLFVDNDPTPGTYKGRRYDAVARNYRPDHLAVLVGKKGACSLEDGCGVNNCCQEEESVDWIQDLEHIAGRFDGDDFLPLPGAITANADPDADGPLLLPTMNFDPSQPRDEDGRWTDGGGGRSAAQDAYRNYLEPALGRLTLGVAPVAVGLATGGSAGGVVDSHAIAEAKDVFHAIFSRMTLGTGPLAAKAVAAGVRHSPKLFGLLVDGIRQLKGFARNTAERFAARSGAMEQLVRELEADPEQLEELLNAVRAALDVLDG